MTQFSATATPGVLAEERENPWGGGDWRPSLGDCVRQERPQQLHQTPRDLREITDSPWSASSRLRRS